MSRNVKKGSTTESQQENGGTANSGQNAQSESRPTGRIDHPTGKYQYIEQEQEQERPTGRVDHPTGKYQYIDQDEPQTVNTIDKSTMVVDYTVTVTAFGRDKKKVLDLTMGKRRRSNDSAYGVPIKVCSSVQKDMLELADKLILAGATVEVKKTITIEIPII